MAASWGGTDRLLVCLRQLPKLPSSANRGCPCRHVVPLPPPPAGCDRLDTFGDMCQHKSDPFQPLRALQGLRSLVFSRCALDLLPPALAGLQQLRTLLLADNQLWSLAPALAAVIAAGAAGRKVPAAALPPQLEHLVLAGNRFETLQLPALLESGAQLTHLDLSRCWQLHPTPADWRQLLGGLPSLCLLRHSCPLLAAEERGCRGAAQLSAAVGGSPYLQLEFRPASVPRHAAAAASDSSGGGGAGVALGSRQSRSCSSLAELEEAAAAALLSGGGDANGGGRGSWGSGGGGGGHATLADLAATASSGGGGGGSGGNGGESGTAAQGGQSHDRDG